MNNQVRAIVVTFLGMALAMLFVTYPPSYNRIQTLESSLITVSGILAGISISYIGYKISFVKAERHKLQSSFDSLSDKLTEFRRLIYFVYNSRDFWLRRLDIRKFRSKYPHLTYHQIHNQRETSKDRREFWLGEHDFSNVTADFFCALEAVYNEDLNQIVNAWPLDSIVGFDYSIEELKSFIHPSNQIWYYLDGRYEKYGVDEFADTGINPMYIQAVDESLGKINVKYNGVDFHRSILAEIGSDFSNKYLPIMIALKRAIQIKPLSLNRLFLNLIAVLFFGVMVPLCVQGIDIPESLECKIVSFCLGSTMLLLVDFVVGFYGIIEEDIVPRRGLERLYAENEMTE